MCRIRCVTGWDGLWWIVVGACILVIGIILSWCYWDVLHGCQESVSATVRNMGVVIGGVIAIVLAVWRSMVAERQADTAQQGLLNERYQKGAEMLGSDLLSVRAGWHLRAQTLGRGTLRRIPHTGHAFVLRVRAPSNQGQCLRVTPER